MRIMYAVTSYAGNSARSHCSTWQLSQHFSLDPGYHHVSIISPHMLGAPLRFWTSSWAELWPSGLYFISTLSFSAFHTTPPSYLTRPSEHSILSFPTVFIRSEFPFCCRKWEESSPFGIGHTVGSRFCSCFCFDLLFKCYRLFLSV